jgi:hypothetical protein
VPETLTLTVKYTKRGADRVRAGLALVTSDEQAIKLVDGNKTKWHISSEQGAKSDELRENGRWEIEDGNKKIWFAEFRERTGRLVHRPSSH